MTCCSPFSSVSANTVQDPTRHVHYTTGMVLGVEDYRAEFAYHAARAQWIMRECGGYGTLAGLAVRKEEDGGNGPRLRVSAGSAATPAGQLIHVAADQCGGINAWLSAEDIKAKVSAIAAATPPGDKARLNLWLMLAYRDCAVSPVPIPGQPCRSEEDLMAPSRVADDYLLSLSLDPPVMSEARALAVLETYVAAWVWAAGDSDEAARGALTKSLETQLTALFAQASLPVTPADLAPLSIDPALRDFAMAELRRIWITMVRPAIMAQRGAADPSGEDGVLLARINLPVIKVDTHWEVGDGAGVPFDLVTVDQSARPYAVAGALGASIIGALPLAPGGAYAVIDTAAALADDTGMAAIVMGGTGDVTLNDGGAGKVGQVWLRNLGAAQVTLKVASSGKIDGQISQTLPPGAIRLLITDGAGNWTSAAGGGA